MTPAAQAFVDQMELETLRWVLAMLDAGVSPVTVLAALEWWLAEALPQRAREWAPRLSA